MGVNRFDAIFDGEIMLDIQITIRLCQHSINLQFYQLFYLILFIYYSYSLISHICCESTPDIILLLFQMNKSKTGLKNETLTQNKETKAKIRKNLIRKVYNKEEQNLCLFGYKSNWLDISLDESIDLKNLSIINLGKCGITDSNAKGLSKLKMPNIKCLYLQFNSLSAAGVKSIFQSDFPLLKCVTLSHNNIQSGGLQILTESLKNKITMLSLENCNISGIGLKFIPNSNMKNLTQLVLSDNKIGLTGIKYLKNVNMSCLQKLYIQNCEIGNQGTKHLSKGKWSNIQHLLLRNNYIRSDGLENIKQMSVKQAKIISAQMEDPITIMNMLMIDCSCSIPKQIKNRKMNNDMNVLIQERFLVQQEYY